MKRKRQLSITKARGYGSHPSTSKNGVRLGYGAEDEDEDEGRYSQALPAEQIKSLSPEDAFQIWVADDKNTLGATSDPAVQKKSRKQ
jgi:hypothetical protein